MGADPTPMRHAGGVVDRRWTDKLPEALAAQRRLLEGLLEFCELDATVSWLVLGCSLARGSADHLSDLDLAMGVEGEDLETAAEQVRRAVVSLAEPVDSLLHRLPGVTTAHLRLFVQFADRTQIDLVLAPARASSFAAGTVVLYDPEDRVNVTARQSEVDSATVREWAFLACCALVDVGKYLRRGSAWEAFSRLNASRDQTWKLVAYTLAIRDPEYGVTSILDFAAARMPEAMRATVADLDLTSITTAARQVAALLAETGDRLPTAQRSNFPLAMLEYVTTDLASVPTARALASNENGSGTGG